MHADNTGYRCAEELPIAHHRGCMFLRVLGTDAHRPEDLLAQLVTKVLERSRQRRNVRRPTLRLFGQGEDEAVPARSGYKINMPRLDVGVRWRALGQAEGLIQ